MQCSVPCMPVESKAGNRVTWNHFFFVQPASEQAVGSECKRELCSRSWRQTPARELFRLLICDSQSSPQYCSLSPGKPGAVGQTSVCGGLQPASARLPANDVKPAAGGLKSAAG